MSKKSSVPVFYTTDDISGVCRISSGITAKALSGASYSAEGHQTSHYGKFRFTHENGETEDFMAVVKNADGFNNSLATAYEALDHWKRRGYKGSPYSAASFARAEFEKLKRQKKMKNRVCASVNNILRDKFTGAWIEATCRGYVLDEVYHYDINSAYLAAALKGLPAAYYPYTGKGDPLGYVVEMLIESSEKELPNFLERPGTHILTSEEIEYYGIRGFVFKGVQYHDLSINLADVLYELTDLPPDLFKRCTQAFWGMFASTSGIDVEYMSDSENRKMWNRRQNIGWAALITRRVAMEVHRIFVRYGGFQCFVDSVLCTREIPEEEINSDTGGWKLVDKYKYGVYLKAPGVWDALESRGAKPNADPSNWKKHSGIK